MLIRDGNCRVSNDSSSLFVLLLASSFFSPFGHHLCRDDVPLDESREHVDDRDGRHSREGNSKQNDDGHRLPVQGSVTHFFRCTKVLLSGRVAPSDLGRRLIWKYLRPMGGLWLLLLFVASCLNGVDSQPLPSGLWVSRPLELVVYQPSGTDPLQLIYSETFITGWAYRTYQVFNTLNPGGHILTANFSGSAGCTPTFKLLMSVESSTCVQGGWPSPNFCQTAQDTYGGDFDYAVTKDLNGVPVLIIDNWGLFGQQGLDPGDNLWPYSMTCSGSCNPFYACNQTVVNQVFFTVEGGTQNIVGSSVIINNGTTTVDGDNVVIENSEITLDAPDLTDVTINSIDSTTNTGTVNNLIIYANNLTAQGCGGIGQYLGASSTNQSLSADGSVQALAISNTPGFYPISSTDWSFDGLDFIFQGANLTDYELMFCIRDVRMVHVNAFGLYQIGLSIAINNVPLSGSYSTTFFQLSTSNVTAMLEWMCYTTVAKLNLSNTIVPIVSVSSTPPSTVVMNGSPRYIYFQAIPIGCTNRPVVNNNSFNLTINFNATRINASGQCFQVTYDPGPPPVLIFSLAPECEAALNNTDCVECEDDPDDSSKKIYKLRPNTSLEVEEDIEAGGECHCNEVRSDPPVDSTPSFGLFCFPGSVVFCDRDHSDSCCDGSGGGGGGSGGGGSPVPPAGFPLGGPIPAGFPVAGGWPPILGGVPIVTSPVGATPVTSGGTFIPFVNFTLAVPACDSSRPGNVVVDSGQKPNVVYMCLIVDQAGTYAWYPIGAFPTVAANTFVYVSNTTNTYTNGSGLIGSTSSTLVWMGPAIFYDMSTCSATGNNRTTTNEIRTCDATPLVIHDGLKSMKDISMQGAPPSPGPAPVCTLHCGGLGSRPTLSAPTVQIMDFTDVTSFSIGGGGSFCGSTADNQYVVANEIHPCTPGVPISFPSGVNISGLFINGSTEVTWTGPSVVPVPAPTGSSTATVFVRGGGGGGAGGSGNGSAICAGGGGGSGRERTVVVSLSGAVNYTVYVGIGGTGGIGGNFTAGSFSGTPGATGGTTCVTFTSTDPFSSANGYTVCASGGIGGTGGHALDAANGGNGGYGGGGGGALAIGPGGFFAQIGGSGDQGSLSDGQKGEQVNNTGNQNGGAGGGYLMPVVFGGIGGSSSEGANPGVQAISGGGGGGPGGGIGGSILPGGTPQAGFNAVTNSGAGGGGGAALFTGHPVAGNGGNGGAGIVTIVFN